VDYESHAAALDRNELGALLVAAGLGPLDEHALVSLLALNGLRVSEATGADIEHLGLDRGHRTLTITRKGGKVICGLKSRRLGIRVGRGNLNCPPRGSQSVFEGSHWLPFQALWYIPPSVEMPKMSRRSGPQVTTAGGLSNSPPNGSPGEQGYGKVVKWGCELLFHSSG
jgi:hypothetical protein